MTKKSRKLVPNPTDPSLKPLPKLKGGYYRRIADIDRALDAMGAKQLPPVVQFLINYFACEKLALGIVGIANQWPVADAYHVSRRVNLSELKSAAKSLKLSVSDGDLDLLFGLAPATARTLRNTLNHDLGPSNVKLVGSHCGMLVPIMSKFLGCVKEVHNYQRRNF